MTKRQFSTYALNTQKWFVVATFLLSWKCKMNFLSKQQSLWEMDSRLSMSLRKDFETDVKEFQTIQNQTALWYFASFFLVLIYLLPQDTMVNQNNLRVQYCKISPQNSYKFCVSQDNFFIVLFLALFNEFLCLW